MPPKKDAPAAGEPLLVGFTDKETKLIAAASVSSIGPDKYDWDMMHDLTGFTVGTLKKFWPPVKKKVIETYPSYATFIGAPGAAGGETKPAATPKGKGKRKAADEEPEGDAVDADNPDVKTKRTKKAPAEKKVPAKGRAKRVKQEEASDEDAKFKSAEDSADGGDGLAAAPETEDEV